MRRNHKVVDQTWRRPAIVRSLGLISAIYLACSGAALAALHCDQPADAVSKKICSYTWEDTGYTLEDLDTNLNLIYQAAMDRVVDKDKLRKEQRAWIKMRDKCEDAKCFNDTYDARIRELAAIPGQSVFNSINFLGSNLGINSDSQMFEAILNSSYWLLSRNGGLKYLDGGMNDFDIVGQGKPIKGTDPENPLCQFVLFGIGKTFRTSCYLPTTPDGTALRMASLPGNRRDGFDERREPLSSFPTVSGLVLNVVSFNEEKILNEASGSRCESFSYFLEARSSKSGKLVWRWMYYSEPTLDRTCKFSNKLGVPSVVVKAGVDVRPNGLLPGGDVLVGLIRIDPLTGLPRDRLHVAVLSKEQAFRLKRQLVDEYLNANPACQGKPDRCPDPTGALRHMETRLPDALKAYRLPAKSEVLTSGT